MPAPYLVCCSASVDCIYTHSPTGISISCAAVCSGIWGACLESVNTYRPSLSLSFSLSPPPPPTPASASAYDSSFWITQIVLLLFLVSFMGLGAETPSFSCLMMLLTYMIPMSVFLSLSYINNIVFFIFFTY